MAVSNLSAVKRSEKSSIITNKPTRLVLQRRDYAVDVKRIAFTTRYVQAFAASHSLVIISAVLCCYIHEKLFLLTVASVQPA